MQRMSTTPHPFHSRMCDPCQKLEANRIDRTGRNAATCALDLDSLGRQIQRLLKVKTTKLKYEILFINHRLTKKKKNNTPVPEIFIMHPCFVLCVLVALANVICRSLTHPLSLLLLSGRYGISGRPTGEGSQAAGGAEGAAGTNPGGTWCLWQDFPAHDCFPEWWIKGGTTINMSRSRLGVQRLNKK